MPINIFISHSAKTSVSALLSLLSEEGAIIRGSFEMAPGANPMESIRTEMQSADAVIVLLDSDASNVFFELGIASGLRKPMLVLMKPGDSLPPFVAFTPYLTYTGAATEILKLGIEGFLGTLRPHKTLKRADRQKHKVLPDRTEKLPTLSEEMLRLRAHPQKQELQALIHSVLTSAGVTSVQDGGPTRESGVDFVVWSESLRGSFGNPLLIEVKGFIDETEFQSAYLRLTRLVSESKSAAGVLLYLKKPNQSFERPWGWNPLVLWFDIEEFIIGLLHRSVAEILVERRNLMVHGMRF